MRLLHVGVLARVALLLAVGVAVATPPAIAADEPPPERWRDTAEFSYVATAGNAETQTLGFKNKLWRKWAVSSVEFNAGGVRSEATRFDRFALGTTASFNIQEVSESELKAENYFANGRYDRKISDRFFWFAGAGWDRNRPAGVKNRYVAVGGVGNVWIDREDMKFRSDYGATWTSQDDVIDDPAFDSKFTGLRVSWSYLNKLGAVTTYTHDTALDANVEESDDWRGTMLNALSVTMSSRLALKVSLQWLFDNSPALESIALFDPMTPPPGTPIGSVLVELDELDTIFTTSLVVNF